MLDVIRSFFKKEFQLGHMSLITGHLADIMILLEDEYIENTSLKNPAIDAVIKLLQEYKDPELVKRTKKNES